MPRRSYITTLASYVVANLCGCTPTLEVTDACALGALNLQASGWDHAVISELNLDCLLWPEIAEPGVRAGEIRIGLRRLPVFASLGRHQCSQVGVFLEKEELSVNLSEWPCISQIAAVPEEGAFEVQPFFDGQFLRTSYNLPSCGIFRTLNNLLKAGEPERCRQNGSETRGHHQKTGGPLPVFENGFARSKRNFIGNGDHDATTNAFSGALLLDCLAGSFYGVISDEVASCARRLTPEGGWKQVVFSGKPVCPSAAFRQKLCDRLGREHTLAPSEENSLLGLLVICLAYTGLTHSVSDALATARTEFRTEEPASHF